VWRSARRLRLREATQRNGARLLRRGAGARPAVAANAQGRRSSTGGLFRLRWLMVWLHRRRTCIYGTTTSVRAAAPPQVIVTGQAPGVVFVPTFHDQLTSPPASAVFGPSPCALLGPLL